jgi:hypothetical protein
MVMINQIYGGGGESPKGLYIRQPRASAASPWEKMSISRTLQGFNREWYRRERGEILLAEEIINGEAERSRFVVPLQGTERDCPVTQGGASLALG